MPEAIEFAILRDDLHRVAAQRLSEQLQLPLIDQPDPQYSYVFCYVEHCLALQPTDRSSGPVWVDYAAGKANHRRRQGGAELIVKAVAGDRRYSPSVFDATAGLGRDSFVLASYGLQVTMCERSPLIAALLEDGLARIKQAEDESLRGLAQRLSLNTLDAAECLAKQTPAPDVVYLDPMFPASGKSALVKKDMQLFHRVVGADRDNEQLLNRARELAVHRVVIKRPKKAGYWLDEEPTFSLAGKTVRFDIFTNRAFPKR